MEILFNNECFFDIWRGISKWNKNWKGKEYKLININLINNVKGNDKIIEKSKINLLKEQSEFFENARFKNEDQVGIINLNQKEYIYYRKLEYEG